MHKRKTRPGYKKTTLGEIAAFRSGGTPRKTNPAYWGGKHPWVSAKDLKRPIVFDSQDTLTDIGYKNANVAPKGSLLILVRGMTLHKKVPVCLAGKDLAFNQDLKALIPADNVSPGFLLYCLLSNEGALLRLVDSAGHGTGRLNTDLLKMLPILLPPLAEQKAIAAVLSVWDQAIEKTERLIQAKEQRLEAYGQDIFKRNKIGKSNGWKLIKVADVLHEHGDKSTGVEEVYSVSVHKGLINQVEHLGRSFSAANTDHYNRVHHGDIVYTKSPTGDFPLGIVKQSYSHKDVIVSPLYGVFTPQNYFLGVVIDFYFSSPTQTKNYLAPIIQKGAKNTIAITNKTFLSAKLHLPVEPSIQRTISEYVETARKEIDLLKKLAEKQKLQKRGLMQKLLTGEWRVKGGNTHEL